MLLQSTRWLVLKVFLWVASPSAAQWGNHEAPVQILVSILRCPHGTIAIMKTLTTVSPQHLPSPPYLNLQVSSGWLHRIASLRPMTGIPQLPVVWQTSLALRALRSLRQWWVVQLALTAMPPGWSSTPLAIVYHMAVVLSLIPIPQAGCARPVFKKRWLQSVLMQMLFNDSLLDVLLAWLSQVSG